LLLPIRLDFGADRLLGLGFLNFNLDLPSITLINQYISINLRKKYEA